MLIAASLFAHGNAAFAQGIPPLGVGDVGGTVTRITDDGPLRAAVRNAGPRLRPALAPQSPPRPGWAGRHPVILGTLIGAGGGAVLSRTSAVGGANHDPRVAFVGAGAGAWGGLVASAVKKARAGEKVGLGAKIGIAAGAIGIVVLPLLACYGAGGCGGVS